MTVAVRYVRAVAITAALMFGLTSTAALADDLPATLGGSLRILHAVTGPRAVHLEARVDGLPFSPTPLGWARTSPWRHLTTGDHEVVVVMSDGRTAAGRITVCAGCSVTVAVVQTDPAQPRSMRLVSESTPPGGRIPDASARIDAALHLQSDIGPVRIEIAGRRFMTAFASASGPVDVPQGDTDVRIQSPDGLEVFARSRPELLGGHSYTIAWLGGGETPTILVVLEDGVQAPKALETGTRIDTGLPSPSPGSVELSMILCGLAAFALGLRKGRRVAGVIGLSWALLLVTSCGTSPNPAGVAPPHEVATESRAAALAIPAPGSVRQGRPSPARHASRVSIPLLRLDVGLRSMSLHDIAGLPGDLGRPDVGVLEGGSPGAPGTVLLVGHHDFDGTGAFAQLDRLRPGDFVMLQDDVGSVVYVVAATLQVPKGHLPEWIWGPQPVPSLALVTCEGPADPRTGLHRDNLLVWAAGAPNP